MKKISNYYLILLIILNFGALMFYLLRFNPFYQIWVLMLTSLAYVFWGLIHHFLEDDLHPKVILEYILIAMLVNLVVMTLLIRA
jgi:hypothetical protein